MTTQKLKLLLNPNCEKTPTQIETKLKNSNCDKTQIETKLKNSNGNKTKKEKNAIILNNSNYDNPQTQIVTKL